MDPWPMHLGFLPWSPFRRKRFVSSKWRLLGNGWAEIARCKTHPNLNLWLHVAVCVCVCTVYPCLGDNKKCCQIILTGTSSYEQILAAANSFAFTMMFWPGLPPTRDRDTSAARTPLTLSDNSQRCWLCWGLRPFPLEWFFIHHGCKMVYSSSFIIQNGFNLSFRFLSMIPKKKVHLLRRLSGFTWGSHYIQWFHLIV